VTTGRRRRVYCGACGTEVSLDAVTRTPSARAAVAWSEATPHPSLWRCDSCVEAGRLEPDSSEGAWHPGGVARPPRAAESVRAAVARDPVSVASTDGIEPVA